MGNNHEFKSTFHDLLLIKIVRIQPEREQEEQILGELTRCE